MYVITHHKIKNKLKVWETNSPETLLTSLLANRGIASTDLDIYQITSPHRTVADKTKFSFTNSTTLVIKKCIMVEDIVSETRTWDNLEEVVQHNLYSPTELDDIAFNKAQPDDTTWIAVPTKDVDIVKSYGALADAETITVAKLNPFV